MWDVENYDIECLRAQRPELGDTSALGPQLRLW